MSRVGREPVVVPEKVDVKIDGAKVTVKGPNGNLEYTFTDHVKIEMSDGKVLVTPNGESRLARSLWGTTRSVINNMVIGTSAGFTRVLEYNGVGYKAVVKGDTLELSLGYSHPIHYKLPVGVSAKVAANTINLTGCNKELLGMTAAKIRSFRPPEPYKGKGIKYKEERIIRKAGKTGAKAG
ncbi:MAG: 50S ribosomal protein L6 [Bdellovibrionales bacterium]|jgi:large subunit ribosomal protein L6|nr:50S ribosomal protein L6 [Bdellovibrionales bacterium]MBT3526007.1 50S ribosomal protein L6 [Bdellovibrionales bacterium]MBT7668933.1 50S ribosomal protein L6 [Bdellovibrionales bacterium]MBT7767581.1 50S ribosomal protein L6 [Bdellovibrionales bacterium]